MSALPKNAPAARLNAPAAASRVLRGPAASRRASSGRQIAMYRQQSRCIDRNIAIFRQFLSGRL